MCLFESHVQYTSTIQSVTIATKKLSLNSSDLIHLFVQLLAVTKSVQMADKHKL